MDPQKTERLNFGKPSFLLIPDVQFQEGFEFSPEPVAPIVFPDLHVGDVPMQQQIGLNKRYLHWHDYSQWTCVPKLCSVHR